MPDVEELVIPDISIHALREEGDLSLTSKSWSSRTFLSTPSARRATNGLVAFATGYIFLSTPSARRATYWQEWQEVPRKYFYPRPPRRGRLPWLLSIGRCMNFYPRPPRGGRPANCENHNK